MFALLREAFSEQYAQHLMQIWNWKYDSHPLNREAEKTRRAGRYALKIKLTHNDLFAQTENLVCPACARASTSR